jgi:murein L,D-transpeptidase YcbB/YkuD
MPVHVVYMTAWTDEDGVLQFRKDMYKYDRYAAIPNDLQPAANLVAETQQPAKPTKTESK